jgi:peptidoglycan-N-acetylglucosamine deacetylase
MKQCIVTTSWDDGQLQDEKLSSMLLDYGIPGTFYVPQKWGGQLISTNLIKKLNRNFEIGAHALSHSTLTKIDLVLAYSEIESSKEWLEKVLNHEIETFSFPKGKYNQELINIARQVGYKGVRTLDFQIDLLKDSFLLGISSQASNGSPLIRLKASVNSGFTLNSITDWSVNARLLFDRILSRGGLFHLWGHSWEIEKNSDWKKLEDVLSYAANRKDVFYLDNSQALKLMFGQTKNEIPK